MNNSLSPFQFHKIKLDNQLSTEIAHMTQKNLELLSHTQDSSRFASPELVQSWYNKSQKLVFVLKSELDEIAGLLWFGESKMIYKKDEQVGEANWTMGVRLYKDAVGKRLFAPFHTQALTELRSVSSDQVWLAVKLSNARAMKAYQTQGYQTIVPIKPELDLNVSQAMVLQEG